MVTKELTIINKLGIHARPAAQFVKLASKFDADIVVEKDGEEVDGKSILGLMMLAVGHGSDHHHGGREGRTGSAECAGRPDFPQV